MVAAEEPEDSVGGLEDVPGADDIEKEAKEELDRMDGDKDGKVTLEEIQKYFRTEFYSDEDMADSTEGANGNPPTQEEIAELVKNDAFEFLQELDKDRSGSLNLEELKEQYIAEGDEGDEEDYGDMEDMDEEEEDMGDNDVGDDME